MFSMMIKLYITDYNLYHQIIRTRVWKMMSDWDEREKP
ncbi:unnamed protein product [Acanthoscelides obtectus]|uniref:Uncharacterized protein n=1 Tax=Acanthoscelides obtectus TaxID=200917 RepID=A0A9P0K6N3_ACAOB|nr:unnamed protein product [Acanthoscelides obtectus]CAK1631092.1 hypothetical protein AOBTE_LOCUS6753 [Acanthoscelides obtectus]